MAEGEGAGRAAGSPPGGAPRAGGPSKRVRREYEYLMVALISAACLLAALGVGSLRPVKAWEERTVDQRQWLRYELGRLFRGDGRPAAEARADISVVALDMRTSKEMGIFRSGMWLVRKPYVDQIRFFEEYFRPTVLAYDIMFQDSLGEGTGVNARVSESQERLEAVCREIDRVAGDSMLALPTTTLVDMARFAAEQSEIFLSERFSSVAANGWFRVINGFNFRGGWIHPDPEVPPWPEEDICGGDPSGNEENGRRIPYLLDVALAPEWIHFPSAAAEAAYGYSTNATTPMGLLLDSARLGYLNVPRDEDGIVRRVPLVHGFRYRNPRTGAERRVFVPSFALMAVMMHRGIRFPLRGQSPPPLEVFFGREIVLRLPGGAEEYRIPIDEKGRMYLNYNVAFGDFPTVSFSAVAPSYLDTEEAERDAIAGEWRRWINRRIVMVGAVTTGMGDIGPTPLSSETPFVHVHCVAANNILDRCFLVPIRQPLWLALLLFLSVTGICLHRHLGAVARGVFLFLLLYLIVSYAGIHFNRMVLPVWWPSVYLALCLFGVLLYRYVTAERGRVKIRSMFSTMVSGDVLEFLEERPESFSLGGHSADVTVLFADIAGFTPMSERLPPATVTRLANLCFTPLADGIMQHGGYVDKFIGDAVMGVWGAPFPNPRHALEACHATLDLQQRMRAVAPEFERIAGAPLRVRMALNSGSVTAGNLGSAKRLQYTVIGDTVNVASRLEAVNDDFGTGIVMGENTWGLAREALVMRWLGTIVVKGKREPVRVYELVGTPDGVGAATRARLASYEEAMVLFARRRWDEALAILDALLAQDGDRACEFLRERVLACRQSPPPDGWNGEYVRATKD